MVKLGRQQTAGIVFAQAAKKVMPIALDQQRSRVIGSQTLIVQTDFPEKNGDARDQNQ